MSGGPWSFAVISDSHLGQPPGPGLHNPSSGALAAERLRAVAAAAADCDFTIHLGDVIDRCEPALLDQAASILADWPHPVRVCLGNHDTNEPADREAWLRAAPGSFGADGVDQAFTHRGVRFVVLASWWLDRELVPQPCWQPSWGCVWQLPAERLAWLEATLAAEPNCPTVLVHHPLSCELRADPAAGFPACHQPPRPASVAGLDAVLARHAQVRLQLGGHAHAQQVVQAAGRWQVACGALCEYPYAWLRGTVDGAACQITTMPLPADDGMVAGSDLRAPWVAGGTADQTFTVAL